jgi:hypothetical protein
MDKHNRPYKCAATSCAQKPGFTSKGDLERHKNSLHSDLTPRQRKKTYYCSQQGCSRSTSMPTNKPFARKDHLQEHVKRVHNRALQQAPISVQDDPLSIIISQQRRQRATDGSEDNPTGLEPLTTASDSRKRRRVDEAPPPRTEEASAEECCSHVHEVEELRSKVAKLEREQEVSKVREADLEQKLKAIKGRESKLADLLGEYIKQRD